VRFAFELVESIMSKHFKLIADSFFVECVNCLIAFAKSEHFKDIRCLPSFGISSVQR